MSALNAAGRRDPLTAVLVALMVAAWVAAGALKLTGLPHGGVTLIDFVEVSLCIWLAARRVRARIGFAVPALVIFYFFWIATGLLTHAPLAAVATALNHFVTLPALAFFLALQGTSEWRARAFVLTLVSLSFFEFLITSVQSLGTTDPDAIVGTFGPFASAVTAAVILMAACVAVSGYLVGAPYSRIALGGAALLPLFSAWAMVKFVPVALPIVAGAVVVATLIARRTSWRRGLLAVGSMVFSTCLILASYWAFNPDSFQALTGAQARANYFESASINGTAAVTQQRATYAGNVLASYANAAISVAPIPGTAADGFRIGNLAGGDYTAWLAGADGNQVRVRQRRSYLFVGEVEGATAMSVQTITGQIEWRNAAGNLLSTTVGKPVVAHGVGGGLQQIAAVGAAPRGAVAALPKIAVTGTPKAGAAVLVTELHFSRGTAANVGQQGSPGPKPTPTPKPKPKPTTTPSPPPVSAPAVSAGAGRPFPGRGAQWRMAEHAISGSLTTLLFGKGLGTATVAENLGVHPGDLSPDAEAASYSDFGTLLVERGWTGVAVVGLLALALCGLAIRVGRALPRGRWTTALTLSVPGAVAVMAPYGMIADQMRNRPAALTFWLLVAFGLSPGSFLGDRLRRRGVAESAPDAPALP